MDSTPMHATSKPKRRKTLPAKTPVEIKKSIPVSQVNNLLNEWVIDMTLNNLASGTIRNRKAFILEYIKYLEMMKYEEFGNAEIRQSIVYLINGHTSPEGLWGDNDRKTALTPATVNNYTRTLVYFVKYLITMGELDKSVLANVSTPKCKYTNIVTFTKEQIMIMLDSIDKYSQDPIRDRTIIEFLLDTGVRLGGASTIKVKDVDLSTSSAKVTEKGKKTRTVYFGLKTARSLRNMLKRDNKSSEDPLFGYQDQDAKWHHLTTNGIHCIIKRCNKHAGITNVRCSTHTFRHTFAIMYLRNDGDVFSLQQMLGHTKLDMTRRYCDIAETDVAKAHRKASPMDNLKRS